MRIPPAGESARKIGGRISGMSDKKQNRRRQIKQSTFWYAVVVVVALMLFLFTVSIERGSRAREAACLSLHVHQAPLAAQQEAR